MAVSEERECLLRDWKLPPSSASDVFEVSSCLGFIPDWTVHTVEGEVVLHKEISSSPIFPHQRKRWHQIMGNICLQVGMITVGLKPYKLGTDLSATIFFRDMRTAPAYIHDFFTAESSLSDGPIYFSYYPPFGFSMFDVVEALNIDVKIDRKMRRDESMTLMYKFHYKVLKKFPIDIFVWPSRPPLGEDGRPLSFVTNTINNAERNNKDDVEVLRLKKLVMDRIAKSAAENNLLSYGGGASSSSLPVRNAGLLDWRETGEEHVLKVDVPGFKREDVRVEEAVVEGLRVLEINGNRSQEEEEGGENDRWHCMERSRGKFLRRVRLPEDVKMDKMKAAVENGVLTVIVPKKVEYIEQLMLFNYSRVV